MEKDDLFYLMALTLIPKIGAITAKKLISYAGSPEGVFLESKQALKRIPGIGEFVAGNVVLDKYIQLAEEEFQAMKKNGILALSYRDSRYPWRLKNCEDGPLLLFYRGKPDFARTKWLSVVGTRNSTSYGQEMCQQIISQLAARYPELVIVSGLAYGIDIISHRLALEYNLHTLAVLAHGLNTIYPSIHHDTARRIMENGAIVSDFHTTMKPERNNFLRRNRIIAGLSEATLVVESGVRGGALITAEIASSYNREVLAVPGRATDTYSSGCNMLIRNNIASLIETAEDIEQVLGWETQASVPVPRTILQAELAEEDKRILQCIKDEPGIVQEILSVRTSVPIHKLAGILIRMELLGWISVQPGNRYSVLVKF